VIRESLHQQNRGKNVFACIDLEARQGSATFGVAMEEARKLGQGNGRVGKIVTNLKDESKAGGFLNDDRNYFIPSGRLHQDWASHS
jgi:hypothetical protein